MAHSVFFFVFLYVFYDKNRSQRQFLYVFYDIPNWSPTETHAFGVKNARGYYLYKMSGILPKILGKKQLPPP